MAVADVLVLVVVEFVVYCRSSSMTAGFAAVHCSKVIKVISWPNKAA